MGGVIMPDNDEIEYELKVERNDALGRIADTLEALWYHLSRNHVPPRAYIEHMRKKAGKKS